MTAEARPLVFLGTPPAAATILSRLISEGFNIQHVITRPDAKRGRGGAMSPSAVKEVALAHKLAVSHDLEWLKANNTTPMLGIVVAYGRIIPTSVLDRTQMINVHFSLLPRWRGAAPVERAILAGDTRTGVGIMEVEPTLDTGAVYAEAECVIDDVVTAHDLTHQLAELGADLLVTTLHEGLGTPRAQQGEVTYAEKISNEELRIDWAATAIDIVRKVRCFRAYATINGVRVRVVEASVVPGTLPIGSVNDQAQVGTSDSLVALLRVQPEGKQAMDASAWLRGRADRTTLTFD
jgi:methionyl-tRNA formyltransferase